MNKTKRLTVRFTAAEMAEIKRQADAQNVTKNEYVRVCLAGDDGQMAGKNVKRQLAQIWYQLRRTGLSLNQMAAGVNTSVKRGLPVSVDAAVLARVSDDFVKLRAQCEKLSPDCRLNC